MKNGVSTTLDDLIKAALTGQPYHQHRLGKEAQRYARRLSNAKAPDLPVDLHDDICQQAFIELFHAGAGGLADHTGKAMFRRAVIAAVRVVRASYAAPGQRTRAAKKPASPRVAAEDVGRIADTGAIERCSVGDGASVFINFDLFPDRRAEAEIQRVEDAMDIETILSDAPEQVGQALRLIHLKDEPVEAVAVQTHISRFVLNRRVTAFFEHVRAAA